MQEKGDAMSVKRHPLAVLMAIVVLLSALTVPGAGDAGDSGAEPTTRHPGTSPAENASIQSLLGPELLISAAPGMPETDRYVPAVAANWVRGEYLVVWHNLWPNGRRDIYARRVKQNGRLLSWFAVSDLPNSCLQPAVAYDAANAQYLVVWMYDVHGDGSQYEIWGRIIEWDGPGAGSSFKIMAWPNRTFWSPRVVWSNNRSHYFVVWNAFDTGSGLPTDIAGKKVFVGGAMDASATILTTSTMPHQVDLAYNWSKDEWFIAFVRSYSTVPPATSNDVYGQRISYGGGGALVPGSLIPIATELNHQDAPAVAVDGQGNYIIAFQHEYSAADHDIYGQKLDANGNKLGGNIIISNSPQDERNPAVTASFSASAEYVAVWQRTLTGGEVIAARRWGDTGQTLHFDVAGATFWDTVSPAVTANPPGYLVVYEGNAPGDPTVIRHIYGRQLWPNEVLLPLIVRNKP
jgi:hypothetical protein